ncbi:hypothetical protein LCGC14_0687390, partial [marine sediment metagenome]
SLIVDNTGVFADGSEIVTASDVNIANWDTAYGWGDHDGLYSLLNHKTNELYSPDDLKNLTLTNTNLIYQDGTSQRFIIDSTGTGIFSPDGNKVLLVTNTEAYANGEVILTSSDLPVDRIVSPDTLSNLTINNTGAYLIGNFTVGDERFGVDEGYVYMQSPTKNHNLMVDNTGAFYDGGEIITVSNFPDIDKIISPDGLKNLTITNTALTYNDGTNTRFLSDAVTSRMYAPNGADYISVGDSAMYINDGIRSRIQVDGTHSYMFSPNGQKWVDIINSGLILQGDTDINGIFTLTGDQVNFQMKAKTIGSKSVIGWYKSDDTRIGWMGHGSGANYDLTIRNEGVGGNVQLWADDGLVYINDYLKVSTLTGTGNDYVCVDSTGQMFRSSSGC